MSGQVLSADAIAALVEAAKDGRLPDESQRAPRRRRMRPVDFTRPSKYNADQERRLKRAMEAFCRTASSRLSAELRVPLELEMIDTSQLTWRDAHTQVPDGSIAAVAEVIPTGTKLLLASETSLVLGAIELLLGGARGSGIADRRLTEIDWALARHFFDRVIAQMSLIWQDMASVQLTLDQVDLHMETAQMFSVSEPTLSITMEARLDGGSSTLALLLPWSAIGPVIEALSTQEDVGANRGEDEARNVRRAVGQVDMSVRAEVASREMPIEQVLALKPGDVLSLNAPATGGITLFADKVPVHVAKPGRAGSRRAVQVVERVGGDR